MNTLETLIQEVKTELGADFISTDIVGMDGLSIAGGSADPNFDATKASARFAMVMNLAAKVSDKMNVGAVDHNLVTTDQAYIITRFLGDSSYYWGLAITKDAVLGLAYILMDDYAERIWEAIPR